MNNIDLKCLDKPIALAFGILTLLLDNLGICK